LAEGVFREAPSGDERRSGAEDPAKYFCQGYSLCRGMQRRDFKEAFIWQNRITSEAFHQIIELMKKQNRHGLRLLRLRPGSLLPHDLLEQKLTDENLNRSI
jgi:hypothetical protein